MTDSRRPIKARGTRPAHAAAAALARRGVSANQISAASVAFALAGAALTLAGAYSVRWLIGLAAIFIVLRLLANMLDGMVAVEHKRASATGPIWNELPDRLSDTAFLVAAGYAAAGLLHDPLMGAVAVALGWLAALAAVLTAYVRELGRALGAAADFSGPFAKPHRMWVLAAALVLTAAEGAWQGNGEILCAALALIAAGTLATVWRRSHRLAGTLREAAVSARSTATERDAEAPPS